ncbi:MAG: hypothetical protein JWM68_1296 [Verrucomicrobiales bacterium]|nr:hypothetical protein [Verrucomicrobiales bacterium]
MKTPEERIYIIQESMRCFVYSLCGFVPLVGILPAILSIVFYRRARIATGMDWNPARTYLRWGIVLAWFNLIVEVIILTVVIIAIVAAVLENSEMIEPD